MNENESQGESQGNFNRDDRKPDRPYSSDRGAAGGYPRRDYNRDDRGASGDRGSYPRRDYNRDDRGAGGDRGGYPRRDYNRDDRGAGGDRSSYPRRDYNRDDRGSAGGGGGYQRRDYNRDDRGSAGSGYQRREFNRDDRGTGGDRGGNPRRDYNRDDRGGAGYQRREFNRDDRGGQRGGGYQRREFNRDDRSRGGGFDRGPRPPRRTSPPIAIPDSPFLLPDHALTQDFQRAIGMTKGTIIDVDPRKKRGVIDIEGFQYKFEDERKRDLQKKYPIQKFKDREIQFAFWPTYSQKAAQYRKIDESPTIKIANLRRTLPESNVVEVIGQVLLQEEEGLFVISVYSASQRKKYMVTIKGVYPGEIGDFIQMFGQLKDGGIHYTSHRVVSIDEETAARLAAEKKKQAETASVSASTETPVSAVKETEQDD